MPLRGRRKGLPSSDSATDAAINYAYNAGCTILAATGNENASTISYPAVHANVIGVGAASPCGERKRSSSSSTEVNSGVSTDPNGYTCDGERWWGSNYGTTVQDAAGAVDIIAPTILPTTDLLGSAGYDPSDYSGFFNGTSCATPYAAGVAALVKAHNPTWTPAQIRAQLVNTAQDVTSVESGTGWDRYTGYGMVDAAAAVGGGSTGSAPVAAFSGTPVSGDFPLTVNFTDSSSNSPTSWSWTFGDGGSSSSSNPSHTYTTAGTYTVSLTVSNAYGSDTDTKTGYITVTTPATGGDYATLPYSTGFESGSLDSYWETFSDNTGRVQITTVNTPHSGSYHMTMDCSSNGTYSTNEAWLYLDLSGESQVDLSFWWKDFSDETHSTDGVYISDDGGASFVKVQDLNGASYSTVWSEWAVDIDEVAAANSVSLSSTFVIKFQQYDNYTMTTDGMAFDDIAVTAGAAGDPPVASFSGTPTSGDYPLTVSFTDASTNVPTSWAWNFGDGGTSTAQNPSHTYTAAGTYTVAMTATNAFGSDTMTRTNYITVTTPQTSGDYATIPYSTGFESGVLDNYWTTASDNNGRVLITTANTPYSGSYQMTMDCSSNGTYSTNQADLALDLTGETEVDLTFHWKEFGDETHSQDGVYFSDDDGASFVKVQDLNGSSYSNQTWQTFTLDLDALASANGLDLTGTFIVRFQQYDNYTITTDGFAFDDIEVTVGSGNGGGSAITSETEDNGSIATSNGPVGNGTAVSGTISSSSDDDYFWFDVDTAGNINISVAIGSSADLDWYLYNSSGTQVDRGYTVSNPEAGSYTASVGRYYVRVDGYNGATSSYTLTVDGGLAPGQRSPREGRPADDLRAGPERSQPVQPDDQDLLRPAQGQPGAAAHLRYARSPGPDAGRRDDRGRTTGSDVERLRRQRRPRPLRRVLLRDPGRGLPGDPQDDPAEVASIVPPQGGDNEAAPGTCPGPFFFPFAAEASTERPAPRTGTRPGALRPGTTS